MPFCVLFFNIHFKVLHFILADGQVDFSSLRQLREIGADFLKNCTGLTRLDQIILPSFSQNFRSQLEETFRDNANILREIQDQYTEGYHPPSKNTKRAVIVR